MSGPALSAFVALATFAAVARADVIVLRDGDRITGKVLFEGTRTIRVQTPYGRLAIPRSKIERILKDDGRQEVLNPSAEPPRDPPLKPKVNPLRLVLVITGKTFWHAWPARDAPADPILRLQVRLDEEPIATYVDASLEPDIPGAVVNSFSFAAEDVISTAGAGVSVLDPEARPGRIVLKIDVPLGHGARRRLGLAYQTNEGSPPESFWRDLVGTSIDLELRTDGPTFVQVQQDRGRMEFSGFPRRRMKNVETFRIEARPDS